MRNTGPDHKTLEAVKVRMNGMCLRCQRRPGEQCHHRQPRGMGGSRDPKINSAENLVWLCLGCHSWAESNRAAAYAHGWLVKRGADAAEQYLITQRGQMLMLHSDGSYTVDHFPDDIDEVPF